MSSDFTLADLRVLISNAIKSKYNKFAFPEHDLLLSHEDFADACGNFKF